MTFKSYQDAEKAASDFECDGTCNGDSDVCAHRFAWPCPGCTRLVSVARDSMDAYHHVGGMCESCNAES